MVTTLAEMMASANWRQVRNFLETLAQRNDTHSIPDMTLICVS